MNRMTKFVIAAVAMIALAAVGVGVAAAQTGGTTTPAPAQSATPATQDSATDVRGEDNSSQADATPNADSSSGRQCPKENGADDGDGSSSTPSTTATTLLNLA